MRLTVRRASNSIVVFLPNSKLFRRRGNATPSRHSVVEKRRCFREEEKQLNLAEVFVLFQYISFPEKASKARVSRFQRARKDECLRREKCAQLFKKRSPQSQVGRLFLTRSKRRRRRYRKCFDVLTPSDYHTHKHTTSLGSTAIFRSLLSFSNRTECLHIHGESAPSGRRKKKNLFLVVFISQRRTKRRCRETRDVLMHTRRTHTETKKRSQL